MKIIPIALAEHVIRPATTMSYLWRIERRDGVVIGCTDADRDILIDGVNFGSSGFTASAVQTTASMAVDNLTVTGILSSPLITDADLLSGLFDHARIEVAQVNRRRPQDGLIKMRSGFLGEIITNRGTFSAELRGLLQSAQAEIGNIVTAGCTRNLGDAKCKFSVSTRTVAGTITSVTSGSSFAADGVTNPAGYFRGGLLTWVTGANSGNKMEVRDYTQGVFTLQESMGNLVNIGDTFTVYQGCDKSITTCHDVFSNTSNFRGFPHLPGLDRYQSGK